MAALGILAELRCLEINNKFTITLHQKHFYLKPPYTHFNFTNNLVIFAHWHWFCHKSFTIPHRPPPYSRKKRPHLTTSLPCIFPISFAPCPLSNPPPENLHTGIRLIIQYLTVFSLMGFIHRCSPDRRTILLYLVHTFQI